MTNMNFNNTIKILCDKQKIWYYFCRKYFTTKRYM